MIKYDSDLKIFTSSLINNDHIISGFSTRDLGDGNNINNIRSFFDQNEIIYKTLVTLEQIHSTNIATVDQPPDGELAKIEETDGIISNLTNLVLIVRTADCLPIIFFNIKTKYIGISHQGWRGSLKNMAGKMINMLVGHGADTNDIRVAIGPGIGECCYTIDEDRYYQFLEEYSGFSKEVIKNSKGRRHLNIMKLNYLLLVQAGIKKENIDFFPFCTHCDQKRFFSFRRTPKQKFQEMFSFIVSN